MDSMIQYFNDARNKIVLHISFSGVPMILAAPFTPNKIYYYLCAAFHMHITVQPKIKKRHIHQYIL